MHRKTITDTSDFACTKTKVAPKNNTIPRLELCTSILLMKLVLSSRKYLHGLILCCIRSSPHKWKPFVSNRGNYIHERINVDNAVNKLLTQNTIVVVVYQEISTFISKIEFLFSLKFLLRILSFYLSIHFDVYIVFCKQQKSFFS